MEKKTGKNSEYTHTEILFIKDGADEKVLNRNNPSIRWFNEEMTFDTIREADEWVCSDAYIKIGFDYDGYRTTDPKLAYALLYHLTRANTLEYGTRKVFADEEFIDNKNFYLVWVTT